MLIKALIILLIIFVIIGVISFLLSMYNFLLSVQGIKGSRQTLTSLLGPFSFVFASNFDEKGNIHRNKFTKYLVITILSGVFAFGLKLYIDKLQLERQAQLEISNKPNK